MEKIKYSNLSWPLKVAVISAWVVGILNVISFIVGFIIGYVSVI